MCDACADPRSARVKGDVGAPVPDATASRTSTASASLSMSIPALNKDDSSASMSIPIPRAPERASSRWSLTSRRSRFADAVSRHLSPTLFSQYIVATPTSTLDGHPSRRRLSQIIDSTTAQVLMAVVTIVSFVDVVAEADARSLEEAPPDWLYVTHHILFVVFLLELAARLYVEGATALHNVCTIVDIAVVVSGALEYTLAFFGFATNLAPLRILRLSRLLKLSRVVFRVPFFYELRKMIRMIGSCMKTLFWSVLVLSVVLTGWSVIAVELLNPVVKELVDKGHWSGCTRCHRAFRTVFECNVTFFQTIVAGDSWGKMAIPIIEAHPWTAVIFVGALLTVVFGVLNVVVAVVVDSFAEARERDILTRAHEMALEEKREKKALRDIFDKVDRNGDGTLDLSEIKEGAARVEMFSHWLRVLDIDAKDLEEMFAMLDRDGSGDVDASEFIEFMYRLKNSEARTATQFVKAKVSQLVQQAAENDKARGTPSQRARLAGRDPDMRPSSFGRTCSARGTSRSTGSFCSPMESVDTLDTVPESEAFGQVDDSARQGADCAGRSCSGRPPRTGESPRSPQPRAQSHPLLGDLPKPGASAGNIDGLANALAPKISELLVATMQMIDVHQEKLISQAKTVKFDRMPRSASPPPRSAIPRAESPSPGRVRVETPSPAGKSPAHKESKEIMAMVPSLLHHQTPMPEAMRPVPFLLQDSQVTPSCHRSPPAAPADVDLESQAHKELRGRMQPEVCTSVEDA